jgi:Na+/melibiose symporter-like transporter
MATQVLTQFQIDSSATSYARSDAVEQRGNSIELHPIVVPQTSLPLPPGTISQHAAAEATEPDIHDQTSGLPFGRLISAYLCLAAIYFISSLDINSVATALQAISRSLDAGNSITWTGTSYIIGQTAFQVLYGRLSDIFGRKPVLMTCIGFLILGDILCGFAQNSTWLYICRALSGIGGGGISSLWPLQ